MLINKKTSEFLCKSIKNAYQSPKFKSHADALDKLVKDISQIEIGIDQLSTIFSDKWQLDCAQDLINRYLMEGEEKYCGIKSQLKEIEATFLSILDSAQSIPVQKSAQSSPDIRPTVQNPEREVFLIEREKINQAYKESVEQRRLVEKEKFTYHRICGSGKKFKKCCQNKHVCGDHCKTNHVL